MKNEKIEEILKDITMHSLFEFEEKNKEFLLEISRVINDLLSSTTATNKTLEDLIYTMNKGSFELGVHVGIKYFLEVFNKENK